MNNPFKQVGLVEVEVASLEELESLLNEDEYQAFIHEGEE